MYPRRSSTTHTEALGEEASVYDWAHAQVHALNPTAARVWRLCDGATSVDTIAAALQRETGIPETDAVVDLTLKELARLHLLELPAESLKERPAPTRRWLLERGLAAALLPAVYTILTPSALEAQSPGGGPPPAGAPTLSSVSPNQGTAGNTVAVTLTGTNFVAGATVNVAGGGVTVSNVVVSGATSLTASFVLAPAAAAGARTVTVTTIGGTSGAQTFTINAAAPLTPTLTSITPNQGTQGATVAVTLTGTNFVVGATTVNVSGVGVTVSNVVVGSTTALTASFVIAAAAATGSRTVTVTTAAATSSGLTFTVNALPGSATFTFTGSPQQFALPAGVGTITIDASGARGGKGGFAINGGSGGLGGRTVATVSVAPGASLTVRVGGLGGFPVAFDGGFNGGGGSAGNGGGGGGASHVYLGDTPLVIAGGGGGGGSESGGGAIANPAGGNGGGGGLTGGVGVSVDNGGGGGGGGTQGAGGVGGTRGDLSGIDGTAGASGSGGIGGYFQPLVIGGGGGGGGYFGGGGGGGGDSSNGAGGGGGGSSFTMPTATNVAHTPGVNAGAGSVTISW